MPYDGLCYPDPYEPKMFFSFFRSQYLIHTPRCSYDFGVEGRRTYRGGLGSQHILKHLKKVFLEIIFVHDSFKKMAKFSYSKKVSLYHVVTHIVVSPLSFHLLPIQPRTRAIKPLKCKINKSCSSDRRNILTSLIVIELFIFALFT